MSLYRLTTAKTLGPLLILALWVAPAVAQQTQQPPDSAALIARGAELFSRTCQRCHNPRSPGERNDREWVIIMQHMETRANLTRDRARAVRAFLLASNEAALTPGRARTEIASVPDTARITPEMIAAGKDIFEGPGGCAACHGADLGGGPIAPNLKDDRWRTGDGSLAAILDVIRNGVQGTAMAAYPAGITDEMAVQVATYVWAVSRGRVEP